MIMTEKNNQANIQALSLFEDKKEYNLIIKSLRDVELKQKVKDILEDKLFDKEKVFDFIGHSHSTNPNKAQWSACKLCQYQRREVWSESFLNSLTGTEKNRKNKLLKSIKIVRGRDDDVMGMSRIWG